MRDLIIFLWRAFKFLLVLLVIVCVAALAVPVQLGVTGRSQYPTLPNGCEAVAAASAQSALFSSIRRGFLPTILSISGFRLLCGIRASQSSTTISTSFRLLAIMRRVFAMCPGNHWTDIVSDIFLLPFFLWQFPYIKAKEDNHTVSSRLLWKN